MNIGFIKNKILDNIQNNLNVKNIKYLLYFIANPIILSLYGLSFKSITDKYLNFYTLQYMKELYSGKYPIAYGSLFIPYELLNGMGLKPLLPEVMGGFTAGLGISNQTLASAAKNWYQADLCTFHRSATGATILDLFPKPNFIFSTNLACDAACKSFEAMAKKYNLKDNFYFIDVPYNSDKPSIKYLASQLEDIFYSVSAKIKSKPSIENLKKSINYSNEFRKQALKVNTIRKELFDYPIYYNGLNYILPFFGLCGTKQSANLYKIMAQEFQDKLKNQTSTKKMKKILWLHLKPYYPNEIFVILENYNCRVVSEEFTHVYWNEIDVNEPFLGLANKMLSNPLRGDGRNRLNTILKIVDDYKIDGVIMFSHWGCRQSNGIAKILKDELTKKSIPLLNLDGDCVDKNNASVGQTKTRVEGFAEIINSI